MKIGDVGPAPLCVVGKLGQYSLHRLKLTLQVSVTCNIHFLKIQTKKTATPRKKTTLTDEDRKSRSRIWSDSADCLRWGKAADKAESALQKLMDMQEAFRNEYKKMSKTDRDSVRADMLRTIAGFKVRRALDIASDALNGVIYG
jgi:hypothetical protein